MPQDGTGTRNITLYVLGVLGHVFRTLEWQGGRGALLLESVSSGRSATATDGTDGR